MKKQAWIAAGLLASQTIVSAPATTIFARQQDHPRDPSHPQASTRSRQDTVLLTSLLDEKIERATSHLDDLLHHARLREIDRTDIAHEFDLSVKPKRQRVKAQHVRVLKPRISETLDSDVVTSI